MCMLKDVFNSTNAASVFPLTTVRLFIYEYVNIEQKENVS